MCGWEPLYDHNKFKKPNSGYSTIFASVWQLLAGTWHWVKGISVPISSFLQVANNHIPQIFADKFDRDTKLPPNERVPSLVWYLVKQRLPLLLSPDNNSAYPCLRATLRKQTVVFMPNRGQLELGLGTAFSCWLPVGCFEKARRRQNQILSLTRYTLFH